MNQKGLLFRSQCIIACIVYILSIIGLDVHCDSHNGRTYVVPVIQGISCESIHSDDHCCCHKCPVKDDTDRICGEEKDCTDEISVLEITGSENSHPLCQPSAFTITDNHHPYQESGIRIPTGYSRFQTHFGGGGHLPIQLRV